jgi:hypothetical protein
MYDMLVVMSIAMPQAQTMSLQGKFDEADKLENTRTIPAYLAKWSKNASA